MYIVELRAGSKVLASTSGASFREISDTTPFFTLMRLIFTTHFLMRHCGSFRAVKDCLFDSFVGRPGFRIIVVKSAPSFLGRPGLRIVVKSAPMDSFLGRPGLLIVVLKSAPMDCFLGRPGLRLVAVFTSGDGTHGTGRVLTILRI